MGLGPLLWVALLEQWVCQMDPEGPANLSQPVELPKMKAYETSSHVKVLPLFSVDMINRKLWVKD